MRRRHVLTILVTALLALIAGSLGSMSQAAPPAQGTLVAVRAAHHPGYDRLVFQFDGPLPTQRTVRWVDQIIQDGSGHVVPMHGDAFLEVSFSPAVAHDDAGQPTAGPGHIAFGLPNVVHVTRSGDFEGVVSYGVGLARRQPFSVSTLTNPGRVVIDIRTDFTWTNTPVYFVDRNRVASGQEPYVRAVSRPVIPPATAKGALQRLFAGPTPAEQATGLRFVSSKATGFSNLTVSGGIARVRLAGGCDSGGSTVTVTNEIAPTLRHFPAVDWVKILDPSGGTARPSGPVDSIPGCLEP